MSNQITVSNHDIVLERQQLEWSDQQRQMIRDTYANGASDQEFAVLIETARIRGLDPVKREVFFVKRWDNEKRRDVWQAQVSIDGMRLIAARTGAYDGQDEPELSFDAKGNVTSAKVRVYRKGVSRPFVGVAYFDEYVQKNREGKPTRFWSAMPKNQISKCAEAQALRKAFPDLFGGLYTPEEMEQAENPASAVKVSVSQQKAVTNAPQLPPAEQATDEVSPDATWDNESQTWVQPEEGAGDSNVKRSDVVETDPLDAIAADFELRFRNAATKDERKAIGALVAKSKLDKSRRDRLRALVNELNAQEAAA